MTPIIETICEYLKPNFLTVPGHDDTLLYIEDHQFTSIQIRSSNSAVTLKIWSEHAEPNGGTSINCDQTIYSISDPDFLQKIHDTLCLHIPQAPSEP